MRSSHSICNRTLNRLPEAQHPPRPRNVAIALRVFNLFHQPLRVRAQDLMEELEAEVDGEGRAGEGAGINVEGEGGC
jgi:hypothetical protein